jgi:hypothetical protein
MPTDKGWFDAGDQGCSRPISRFRGRAALSFARLLRQPGGGVLSSPLGFNGALWRTNPLRYLGRHVGRDGESECLSSISIDQELEGARLFYRQVGGFGPSE